MVTKLVRFLTMKSMKGLKKTLTLPWTRTIGASHFFMRFMVSKACTVLHHEEHEVLERRSPLLWTRTIGASHFFYELAHGIARAFMVDSLVWRLPMPFMVRSVQSHGSVYRRPGVTANSETGETGATFVDRKSLSPTGPWWKPLRWRRHRIHSFPSRARSLKRPESVGMQFDRTGSWSRGRWGEASRGR